MRTWQFSRRWWRTFATLSKVSHRSQLIENSHFRVAEVDIEFVKMSINDLMNHVSVYLNTILEHLRRGNSNGDDGELIFYETSHAFFFCSPQSLIACICMVLFSLLLSLGTFTLALLWCPNCVKYPTILKNAAMFVYAMCVFVWPAFFSKHKDDNHMQWWKL